MNLYVQDLKSFAGIVVADFPSQKVIKHIIGLNFNHRKSETIPTQPIYQSYIHDNNHHFYTNNIHERSGDIVFRTCTEFDSAHFLSLYRLCNVKNYQHFYTTDENEFRQLIASQNWRGEGIIGYVGRTSTSITPNPLHRYLNPTHGGHYYSNSAVVPSGFHSEGVIGYTP